MLLKVCYTKMANVGLKYAKVFDLFRKYYIFYIIEDLQCAKFPEHCGKK